MPCLNGERLRAADLFRPDCIAKRKYLHFSTHLSISAREHFLITTPSPSIAGCTGKELRALSGKESKRDSSQKSANRLTQSLFQN